MPIYVLIPNIPGESTSKTYPNQFDVASVTWGGTIPISANGSGKPQFSTVTIQKNSTIHSPTLMLSMAKGKPLGTVVITFTVNNGSVTDEPVEVITLSNAILTSYSNSLESGSPPVEQISFAFSRVDFTQLTYSTGLVKKEEHYWDVAAETGA